MSNADRSSSHRRTRRSSRRSTPSGALLEKPFALASLGLLLLALLVGGGSLPSTPAAAVVQICAFALLPWAAYRAMTQRTWRQMPLAFAIIALAVLVPALQLIPLSPSIWTKLPGREIAVAVYEAAGRGPPWRPLSLTPELTLAYGLALVLPITIFLAWTTLGAAERRWGLILVVIVAVAGLLLGGLQVLGVDRAYLYATTNLGALVGFFANRNHEASLLLCVLPFGAALVAQETERRGGPFKALVYLAVFLAVVALIVVRSRAGILLLAPTLLASFAVIWRSGVLSGGRRTVAILGGVAVTVAAILAAFSFSAIRLRFAEDTMSDMRFIVLPDLAKLAGEHFPTGSGLGSMDTVYRAVEQLDLIIPTFLNHAHNDYLEIAIEAGLLGIVAIVLFLIWFFRALWRAWVSAPKSGDPLILASSVAVGLLLAHSAADYPLRTLAMAAVFAMCCAMMIPAKSEARSS